MWQTSLALVAAGDTCLRGEIVSSLAEANIQTQEVAGGREALEAAQARPPDLLIVDLLLPDVTGLALCRRLREDEPLRDTPLLLLSPYHDEMDRVLAFELGVDDYLPRPFYKRELASRAQAILRRVRSRRESGAAPQPEAERIVRLDLDTRRVQVAGRPAELTAREFGILAALVAAEGFVLTRAEILSRAFGSVAAPEERTVDAHIRSIRRKLGPARGQLETVRGRGYRFSQHPV